MHRRRSIPILLALALLAAAPPLRAQRPVQEARITAIGDVHGDLKSFYRLLRELELVTPRGHWQGGERHLVQTGDLIDRGLDSKRVLQLVKRLEGEAAATGGRVTVLLGNHEVMNLTGNFEYTTVEDFAVFAGAEPPELREDERQAIVRLLSEEIPRLSSSYYQELGREIEQKGFDQVFPPGYFAHYRAFAVTGAYGKWLASHPTMLREDGVLFVHGGVSPRFARLEPQVMNDLVHRSLLEYHQVVERLEELRVFRGALGSERLFELARRERARGQVHPDLEPLFRRLDALAAGPLFAEDGPFWYRGLALEDERGFAPRLREILELQGVERIVIGHTQHPALTIQGRFQNRVVLIDTGLNQEVFGGRASALLLFAGGAVEVWE